MSHAELIENPKIDKSTTYRTVYLYDVMPSHFDGMEFWEALREMKRLTEKLAPKLFDTGDSHRLAEVIEAQKHISARLKEREMER